MEGAGRPGAGCRAVTSYADDHMLGGDERRAGPTRGNQRGGVPLVAQVGTVLESAPLMWPGLYAVWAVLAADEADVRLCLHRESSVNM